MRFLLKTGVQYRPEDISTLVLKHLRRAASRNKDEGKIETVVISVPAYFTQEQILSTVDAATMAGFNCIETLTEPVAAALSKGLGSFEYKLA